MTPKKLTQADALARALWSCIHCPEEYRERFEELAQEFAQGLSPAEIERCKEVALAMEAP